ncbi:MAG: hypothetical protein AB7N80_06500 [Bdellovibrionales bacterium]
MLKKLVLAVSAMMAFQAGAASLNINPFDAKSLATKVMDDVRASKIPLTVGDTASYSIDLAGLLKGTLEMLVREETAEGIWLEQNIDLTIQKQKVETLFDAETGAVKKMLVDGQEQKLEEGGKSEIVESKPDTITVPKGTFECTYLKIRNTDAQGQSSEAELWLNPELVSIVGLIKQVAQSQLGPVTVELTDFKKQ